MEDNAPRHDTYAIRIAQRFAYSETEGVVAPVKGGFRERDVLQLMPETEG